MRLAGCAGNGVTEAVASEVWSMIETFLGYSFCKPHSASYARVSFESAWLKAHHPAEFFVAVINNQGGFYQAIAYLGDARRHGIQVLGPDVNFSQVGFTAEGDRAVRVGLGVLKGLPSRNLDRLLDARTTGGPFLDPMDLQGRTELPGKTMELLARAGAMDCFAPAGDRTRLLWDCIGGQPKGVSPRPTDAFQRAAQELEFLGLTLDLHPAAVARAQDGGHSHPHRAGQVPHRIGVASRFWALVVAEKKVLTKENHPMQFVTLEDETGLVEAVVFPDAFRARGQAFCLGEVVPAAGVAKTQDDVVILEWRDL